MEQLLHYTWKHQLFPLQQLTTEDGQIVEVINPGRHNTDAGPDFLDAKVKIGGILWVGNVEIHLRTSDWFRHHHDTDPAYGNIILHVAADIDIPLTYSNGSPVPQLRLGIPQPVQENYDSLQDSDMTPRCASVLPSIPSISKSSWMSALHIERLELRTSQIMARLGRLQHNWEDTLFVTIARNFGFGKNGDAFETWAHSIPMAAVGKHRDNLFQIEAIFFGQAGLLEDAETSKSRIRNSAINQSSELSADRHIVQSTDRSQDDYYLRLRREYLYLRQKFSLSPIDPALWKFLRMRPQNFPHIRIAQLAMLYYTGKMNLSKLLNADSIEEISYMLHTQVSDYWRTHYTFNSTESPIKDKQVSKASLQLIIINSIVPMLFAYGKYKHDEATCTKALDFMERLKPEKNHIITSWAQVGVQCANAADSQALIQLTHEYCDKHDCIRCRFGNEYISRTPTFLQEEIENYNSKETNSVGNRK